MVHICFKITIRTYLWLFCCYSINNFGLYIKAPYILHYRIYLIKYLEPMHIN